MSGTNRKVEAALAIVRKSAESAEVARQQQPDKHEPAYYEKQQPESRSTWSGDSMSGGRSR
jgi:hypothetical protein